MTEFVNASNAVLDTCILLICSPKYCFVVGILVFLSVSGRMERLCEITLRIVLLLQVFFFRQRAEVLSL